MQNKKAVWRTMEPSEWEKWHAIGAEALLAFVRRLAEEWRTTSQLPVPVRPAVKPGTRLLREWQGKTHTVTVEAAGFRYRDQYFRSLSAVAREITGSRWSGPVFFGHSFTQVPKARSSLVESVILPLFIFFCTSLTSIMGQ